MRSPRLLSLLALLATVALIGCGGDDSPSADDARSSYESVQSRLQNLGQDIGRQIQDARNQTNARLERAFDQLQTRADEATEQLRELDVPGDLADERDALRDAVDRGTDSLGDIVEAVREADAGAAGEAAQRLVTDSQAIAEARQKFEQALDAATR
jgi:predicted  nucleic acid-binding Zn-ribbon protein